jgi:hypothetical protein
VIPEGVFLLYLPALLLLPHEGEDFLEFVVLLAVGGEFCLEGANAADGAVVL